MTRSQVDPAEVLVIGSGVGGLTAAILLLKCGFPVTVVERNPLPGGLMRSYRREGIDCPVGVHYLGALAAGQPLRRMFDFLGVSSRIPLERMGSAGVIDRYVINDFVFDLPEGIGAFVENLRSAFPGEGSRIDVIAGNLKNTAARMDRFDLLFAPDDFSALLESMDSLGRLMEELRCSPGMRGVLGVTSSWIGVSLEDCPIHYHHMALASYLLSSWRPACSGAEMAEAFTDRVRSLGGAVIAGDPVARVLVDGGGVAGAVLESGRTLRAGRVVGAIHPKRLLGLLPEGAVRPAYRRRISGLKDTEGVFCAHFAVDAAAHREWPHNVYRILTDRRGAITDGFYVQLRKSGRPGVNLLSLMTSSPAAAWSRWENTRPGGRGEEYRAAKRRKAEDLLRAAEAMFGPFRGLRLLDAYTHLTLRDWVDSPGGSAYGVLRSTKQLLGAAMLNRTSVGGLFLAGQNVLAPGIFGTVLGSFYTVRQMIGHQRFLKEVDL